MKTKIIQFILCFYNFLPLINIAQWQPDVRLTNDPALSLTSYNNAWCIATSGDVAHVVWQDERNGNDEIYYKRSTDAGISWGTDSRLTSNTGASENPSISVSGPVVHVVWFDSRDGNKEIYYKRSPDGGISWGSDIRLTNNFSVSEYPSISVSSSIIHVVWDDERNGFPNSEIYYKRSTDGGLSWGADTRLTNNDSVSVNPSVSVSGSVVNVVWHDYREGNTEIYYKRSTDGGISWGADTRLTSNSGDSYTPSVSSSNQAVHIVWWDSRDGNYEIYYKRSTDGGLNWGADTRLTNSSAFSGYPSLSVSGSVVHVVWHDNRDGNYEIYYKRDPTGNPVGINIFSSEVPENFKLHQNYPNPFNPSTQIRFDVPKSSFVKLIVYDVLGKEVAAIVNEELKAGAYSVDWNASNYPSGVYYYKLDVVETPSTRGRVVFTETKKMVLVK